MEAVAAVFTADFGAGAQRVTIAELQGQLDALAPAGLADAPPQCRSELPVDCSGWRLVSLLSDCFWAYRNGKAVGPDGVPIEMLKVGGVSCVVHLAGLLEKSLAARLPMAWRGGRMAPVRRKAGAPMSSSNTRGVLCACARQAHRQAAAQGA